MFSTTSTSPPSLHYTHATTTTCNPQKLTIHHQHSTPKKKKKKNSYPRSPPPWAQPKPMATQIHNEHTTTSTPIANPWQQTASTPTIANGEHIMAANSEHTMAANGEHTHIKPTMSKPTPPKLQDPIYNPSNLLPKIWERERERERIEKKED